MRILSLALVAMATPAVAGPLGIPDRGYYGPLNILSGVGYKDELRKDGSWRIVANGRGTDGSDYSINVVLYRAAELARDGGFRYVQMLSMTAMEQRLGRSTSAFLIARPSASPAPPAGCKPGRCYTADVAEVLRLLGGPDGRRPGVALPTYLDKYGRTVTVSGFGIGAASADGAPAPVALPAGAKPIAAPVEPAPLAAAREPAPLVMAVRTPAPVRSYAAVPVRRSAEPSYDDLLRAEQGVHGGDKRQGWTISD